MPRYLRNDRLAGASHRHRETALLALPLVSALLLAATGPPAAWAQNEGKLTVDTATTLVGAPTGAATLTGSLNGSADANALTAFGNKVHCTEATYAGNQAGATPHIAVQSGAQQVTLSPTFGACDAAATPATIEMNGCDYLLQLGEATGEDTYAVETGLVCPEGKHLEVKAFTDEAEEELFCEVTLVEQAESYSGLTATDQTDGTIRVTGSLEGIEFHRQPGPDEGKICLEATTEEGAAHFDVEFEAVDAAGQAVNVSLIEDEGSGTFVFADGDAANSITAFGLNARCPDAIYNGNALDSTPAEPVSSGADEFTVVPEFTFCSAGGLPTTVDMNGCDYVLDINETVKKDVYNVQTTVTCPEEEHIGLTTFTEGAEEALVCETTLIEDAEGYGGLVAVDQGNGTIAVLGAIEGISFSKNPGPDSEKFCAEETTSEGVAHFNVLFRGSEGAELSLSH